MISVEDEGGDPRRSEECVDMVNKYGYTKEDYERYLNMFC